VLLYLHISQTNSLDLENSIFRIFSRRRMAACLGRPLLEDEGGDGEGEGEGADFRLT